MADNLDSFGPFKRTFESGLTIRYFWQPELRRWKVEALWGHDGKTMRTDAQMEEEYVGGPNDLNQHLVDDLLAGMETDLRAQDLLVTAGGGASK